MTKANAAMPKLGEALDNSPDLQVRTAIDIAQQASAQEVMEEPLQPAKAEIAYTVNPDARNRDQATPMVGASTRPTVHDPPFLIELGRWIRRAVLGL